MRFEIVVWKQANVHPDAHVVFAQRMYSVPLRKIGQAVWIRTTARSLLIFAMTNASPRTRASARGIAARSRAICHRNAHRGATVARASGRPAPRRSVARRQPRRDDLRRPGRPVEAPRRPIDRHAPRAVPKERRIATCRRAFEFGNHTYQGIKHILLGTAPLADNSA